MKNRFSYHWLPTLMVCAFCTGVHAQSNIITYQGHLTDGSSPANGLYDLSFELFNDPSAGSSWGATTNTAVVVSNGLFTVLIDVGPGVFDGTDLWLEIGAVTNGGGTFTTLSPRQPITSTPYAIQAQNANLAGVADTVSGNIPSTQISGTLIESQLADNSVTSAKIANNTITAVDLAPASVNTSEIATSAVGTSELANGSVTADKIGGVLLTSQIPNLDADKITTGTIDDGRLSANVALLDADQNFSGINSFDNTGNSFTGSFTGDGSALTNIPGIAPLLSSSSSEIQMLANTAYVATNDNLTTFTLPDDPVIGDVVKITGFGQGGWQVNPNTGQIIEEYEWGEVWLGKESSRNWISMAASTDGSKLVALVDGGQIYTSSNGGQTWTARESNRNWDCVASSADGTRLAAAVDGGQIYISQDSGSNWTARAFNDDWNGIASSADGTKLVAVVYDGPVYTSSDGGSNWVNRGNFREWADVASSSDGSNLVAVASGPTFSNGDNIYTSIDGGITWTAREIDRRWRAVASSLDGSNLVAVEAGGFTYEGGRIHTSVDGGSNWTARESTRNWYDVASSSDGDRLVAVDGKRIYTSDNAGTNWTEQAYSRNWRSVASSGDGELMVAAVSGGQIYLSSATISGSSGESVELQYAGNDTWQVVSHIASDQNVPNSTVVRDDSGGFSAETIEATSFVGSGSGLTALNASQITSGTLSDNRLSSNIAKLNATQTFIAANTFSNALGNFSGSFSGDGSGLTGLADSHSLDASDGSPADALYVDADGDVGIGTTSPGGPLHVKTPVGVDSNLRLVSGASWSLVMNQDPSSVFSIQNGGSKRFFLQSNGNIGIGTGSHSIDGRLHVESAGARVAKFDRYSSDGELVAWARDDSVVGNVTVASGVVSYNAFTGSHYAWCNDEPLPGTLMALTGDNRYLLDDQSGEIIYGVEPSAVVNDPACLGAYVATTPMGGPDNTHDIRLVSAVGNGELWVIDTGTDIRPGDLLISSDVEGCAMLDDPLSFAYGHVIARAAEAVEWDKVQSASDGVRSQKISVLFGSFTRGVSTMEVSALKARLDRLERLLEAQSTGGQR